MARDLIPPPSPAGRPDRESAFSSAALRDAEKVDAALERAIDEEQVEALSDSGFRGRFGVITGALVGIGIAAVVVLVLVLGRDPGPEPRWSKWQPTDEDPNIQLIEIGRYVSAGYRLDNGDQLNKVDAEPLEVDGAALRVVVRTAARGEGANIEEIYGNSVLYTLKGLGPNGSIDSGEPSVARTRLLEREATELALYTFKYVDGVDNVVAILPPGPPSQEDRNEDGSYDKPEVLRAMLYRPGDLEQALKVPLAETLPGETPRPGTMSAAEQEGYKVLAEQHEFNTTITTDQLGTGVLVLDRVSASQAVEDALKAAPKS